MAPRGRPAPSDDHEDPQVCHGGPQALAAVAAMMRRCVCGEPAVEHDLGVRHGREARTKCLTSTADGPCGCQRFTPADSAETVPPVSDILEES